MPAGPAIYTDRLAYVDAYRYVYKDSTCKYQHDLI